MKKQSEEESARGRIRKRRKFWNYLYITVMLILTVANISIAGFLLTYVQQIEVTGTEYSTENQIVSLMKKDPLMTNSVYAVLKYKVGAGEVPEYLADINVGWGAPWILEIEVEEKEIVAGILINNAYVYFAEDGTVITKGTQRLEDVFVVEGVKAKKSVVYEKLETEEEKVFSYMISLAEELKKNELTPDRIIWEEDSMNVHFGEVCARLGKLNYDEKVLRIPILMEELDGKKGVIELEHYSEMNTNISFEETK